VPLGYGQRTPEFEGLFLIQTLKKLPRGGLNYGWIRPFTRSAARNGPDAANPLSSVKYLRAHHGGVAFGSR
jgi:hypothetical protein